MKERIIFVSVCFLVSIQSTNLYAFDSTIAAGCKNGRAAIYHPEVSSDPVKMWNMGSDVVSVATSADGSIIAIGALQKLEVRDRDGNLLWSKDINVSKGAIDFMNYESNSVDVSADGQYIVAGTNDKLYVYKKNGDLHWSHSGEEICVSISPNGKYIGACYSYVRLFSIDSNVPIWSQYGDGKRRIVVSDPGYFMSSNKNNVYFYDKNGNEIWNYSHSKWESDAIRIDISRDGLHAIAGNDDPQGESGAAFCYFTAEKDGEEGWSSSDGTPMWTFVPFPGNTGGDMYSVSISGNSDIIATGGSPSNNGSFVLSKDSNVPLQTFSFGTPQSFELTYYGFYGAAGNRTGKVYYFSKDQSEPIWMDDSLYADRSSGNNMVQSVAIASVSLRLLSPNGGEELLGGHKHTIKWISESLIENIDIEYSTDGGSGWAYIDTVSADTGEYVWDVAAEASEECLIRISNNDPPGESDESDDFFRIRQLILLKPNGGEELLAGDIYDIKWEIEEYADGIDISFSSNNGDSWSFIDTVPMEPNLYEWEVPYVGSTECLIKINDSGEPNLLDTSDDVFTVKKIIVDHPNGGERFRVYDVNDIIWRWNCEVTDIASIELSRDAGEIWEPIGETLGNEGSMQWIVEPPTSDQCLIRVSDPLDPNAYDASDNVFAIHFMELISPNGGEQLLAKMHYPIQWQSDPVMVRNVKIEFSSEYDGIWEIVDANTPNVSIYDWEVPSVTSDQCRIRLSDAAELSNYDVSDRAFTIMEYQKLLPDPNDYISTDPNDYYLIQPDPNDYEWIIGDVTDNGYVDLEDIAALNMSWQSIPFDWNWDERHDLDDDEQISISDLLIMAGQWLYCNDPYNDLCGRQPWPQSWNWEYQCLGDADNSGAIDAGDIDILNMSMETKYFNGSYYPATDFNRDGQVDYRDRNILETWKNVNPLPAKCIRGGWWPPDL